MKDLFYYSSMIIEGRKCNALDTSYLLCATSHLVEGEVSLEKVTWLAGALPLTPLGGTVAFILNPLPYNNF